MNDPAAPDSSRRVLVGHDALAEYMRRLHDDGVALVLCEATGPGWMIEFMTRIDKETAARIVRMGAQIIGPNEGTP